jgi:uncharacterized DUF497 family protein
MQVHPSDAIILEWDEGNESELAAHHITTAEVDEVFERDNPAWVPNKRGRSGNWLMIGMTMGGRLLAIVVLLKEDGDTLRPITGWDADEGERTLYSRKRRR